MNANHERPVVPSSDELARLPADGGPGWNRLVFEKSPYLLQHAANPVQWWPWGEAAFDEARRRGVPVFLSIGYATCHWCHVMERESFEDAEVAHLLNESFVCVKVDREERPDVDHVYMTVTQALTGSGGWPMTVVLTPERKPFFAGTYFPKEGRGHRPGMVQLVPAIAEAWAERRDALVADAEEICSSLARMTTGSAGTELGEDALRAGFDELAARFDPVHGGFGRAPKFPTPHQLSFLLRWHRRSGDALALDIVMRTLRALRNGGIWDHVGFGLHRYSTDRQWLVPHFEKMLYDQALLLVACAEAFLVTREPELEATGRAIAEYVLRDLTSGDGAFLCAEDADSEGEEGRFYVWTLRELRDVLGEEDAALVARAWGATEGGNFRDEATGHATGANILHVPRALSDVATEVGVAEAALRERLESARVRLLAVRSQRVRPLLDDKVLADWNGLMIAALAIASRAFAEPAYAVAAGRAADFVLREVRGPEGRLRKRWRLGESALPAVLDDHAFLAWGLVELHQASLETPRLEQALEVLRVMEEHFADAQYGGWFLTADDGEALPVRAKEAYDGAIPSGTSVASLALLKLARLTGDVALEDGALRGMRAFAGQVRRSPSSHCVMLMAVDFALGPTDEVVIAGARGAADTQAMLDALRSRFLPSAVVLLRSDDDAALARLAPFTRDQTPKAGQATAYVCRNHACDMPTTDAAQLARLS